jgi:hypothetical protein
MPEFVLDNIQAAIFVAEPSAAAFSTGKAVASILTRFGEQFGGEMRALPLPTGVVPADVPRATLQSPEQGPTWQLNLGPARIDCIRTNSPQAEIADLGAAVLECADVLEHYLESNNVRVGRVALIIRRFCRSEHPAQELISRFCSEASRREPLNRSTSFELHNHKVYAPVGLTYQVNSWVRCKTATVAADNTPAIAVEQDLNTLHEEMATRRFNPEETRRFFEIIARDAGEILRKYFPE